MGFIVAEELAFPKFGVSAAGCYITIKASYSQWKQGGYSPMMPMMPLPMQSETPGTYRLYARWFVYAENDSTLTPLREEYLVLDLEEAPANPIATLYAALKSQHFAGKTITDV